MSAKKPETRYAHSPGHTDVCYSTDGERLITCGTDGDIRIWSNIDDYDPFQTCVGEWALCVRQKHNQIQIATDNNSVQLLSYPNGERESILTRFSAPVNHMAVGKEHDFIAIASEDMQVKMIKLGETKENGEHLNFSGVTGPPLSIAICPNAKLLGVSSGDGYLRFWLVETKELLKELKCAPKINSFMNAKLLCRLDFEPNMGKYVAYPEASTVVILSTTDWSKCYTLNKDSVEAAYSIVQYSPCGNFVAAATEKGDVIVWEMESQNVVQHFVHPMSTAICAMVWNPAGLGEIAFCDVEGQLGVVTDCMSTSNKKFIADEQGSDVEMSENKESDNFDFGDIQFEEDDDEDNENAVSLEKLKKQVMGDDDDIDEEIEKACSVPTPRPRTPEVPMQSAFMPSSTPEHLNPRYLCYNDVGIVRCYGSPEDDDNSSKSIEVDFHDSTFHNSMMVQNFNNYTMGTISTAALALATSLQFNVIPLSGGSKEWFLNVEEPINITAIAASSRLVAFATTNYLIHVCTIYGTQRAVFSIPGPLVCMSAYEYSILMAYHDATPRKDDQSIKFMLVKFEGVSIVRTDLGNTLGPECTLFWMGFTDVGNPVVYDSNEMLFIYPFCSNLWLPICDTTQHRKSPCDGFFVTGVFESQQMLRGVRCKGSNYPGFTPRPTLSEIILQPPFVDLLSEKSQLEANLFAYATLQIEGIDKKYKETALKTFALACKNNLDQRALELVEMLGNRQIVNLAVKYSTKMDKRRLSEKLMEVASQLQLGEGEESQLDMSVSTPQNIIRPNRKLVLNSSGRNTPKSRLTKPPTEVYMVNNENQSLNTSRKNESTTTVTTDHDLSSCYDSQNSILSGDEPINPFLKSTKKQNTVNITPNPLSLTDKFAGFDAQNKEVEKSNSGPKRKQPETKTEPETKEKQRKLAQFMFTKKN